MSPWLVLGSLVRESAGFLDSPMSRPVNCAERLACSPRSSLGRALSCATMPISPEEVPSAEGEGGSSLPLGGLPASSAGFLSLVQEVAILLSSMKRRIDLKARRLSLRLTQRRAVRDAAAHLVHGTTHCGPRPSDLSGFCDQRQMANLDLSLRRFLSLALS